MKHLPCIWGVAQTNVSFFIQNTLARKLHLSFNKLITKDWTNRKRIYCFLFSRSRKWPFPVASQQRWTRLDSSFHTASNAWKWLVSSPLHSSRLRWLVRFLNTWSRSDSFTDDFIFGSVFLFFYFLCSVYIPRILHVCTGTQFDYYTGNEFCLFFWNKRIYWIFQHIVSFRYSFQSEFRTCCMLLFYRNNT